jgi:hypothetical protein
MSPAAPDKRPLFNFLSVRAPEPVKATTRLRSYIEDDVLASPEHVSVTHVDPDTSSLEHRSEIAALVYRRVFCNDPMPLADALASLLESLLELLTPLQPSCDDGAAAASALQLNDLTQHTFEHDGSWYVLPDRLDQLAGLRQPLLNELRAVRALVDAELDEFDRTRLVDALEQVFDGRTLDTVVFSDGGQSEDFVTARRSLFDALYLLYMMRRWTAVNLEAVIEALRLLHVLQALAIDVVYERVKASGIGTDQRLISSLARTYPALAGYTEAADVAGFPLIADASDLAAYLDATPVVHPIFARLFWYQKPFNDIQPVGVGDLKVVKHWLRGYAIGEISHIDNVLKGETKTRVHRQLEKSEDVFTFGSEQTQETTRDTQTTDRFELTREAEQVVKSDLAATAGANANVTYKGGPYTIVAGVNASFAYSRSQTDQSKLAQSFAHEVVDRASQRVLSRITQQRTSTKLFETEETNTHTLDNKSGGDHISGFYRWLDKAYRAQVYNYGKRMMFEFTVPEPAAFLVESRLGAFDAQLDVPQPPTPPQDATLPDWLVQLSPADITLDKFRELSKTHDLSAFTYPATTKAAEFIDTATGKNLFTEHGMDSSTWQARTYSCRIVGKDYRITKLIVEGFVYFWGREGLPTDTSPAEPHDINTLEISIDGYRYVQKIDNSMERWYLGSNVASEYPSPADVPLLADDTVSLTFGFWDIAQFDVSVRADLELAPGVLEAWRNRVYAALRAVEQKKVEDENANRRQTYQARLATYHNRLDQLKAMAVNDLLQGQSEAQNRETILAELKRQCLAMLAREFDADASDDLITDWEAMGSRNVSFSYHHLKVDEKPNADNPTQTSVGFDVEHRDVDYPLPDVVNARDKGRYVQFLEQAFEWQQLAYICYPYFWATPPRWIELMNRSDRTDPFYSAFLQAGYARVMIAVTPAYGDAVLHFLATREPWQGGASPVIGDSLYLPIYEELRRQQDDLANATPDGDPWDFTLPTALVYLENKTTPLPPLSNGS